MHIGFLIPAIIAGGGVLALTFKLFFTDWADYLEAWRYNLTPNLLSMVRGEYSEDFWAEIKLSVFHGIGISAGIGTYLGLEKLFS